MLLYYTGSWSAGDFIQDEPGQDFIPEEPGSNAVI